MLTASESSERQMMQESRRRASKSDSRHQPEPHRLAGGSSKRGAGEPLGVWVRIGSFDVLQLGAQGEAGRREEENDDGAQKPLPACHLLVAREAPLKFQ